MNKRLMMRRAIAIPLQTIRANNLPLRLKTTNNRKKIKTTEEQQSSPAEKHTSDADTAP